MGQSFKLKGSLFTLSVLQILTADLAVFEQDLKAKIKLAPKFFKHTPMVLDISALHHLDSLDFVALKAQLEANNIVPIGIKGAKEAWIPSIHMAKLAVMSDHNKNEKMPGSSAALSQGTKIITDPIRGGQRIYAEGGDLIVIAQVSPGAELLADGNIHVYGTLRGRALAGVNGQENARIFCQQLSAELVSIAGHFQLFENTTTLTQGLTEIYLKDNELIIARI